MAMISQIDFLLPKEKDLFFLIVLVDRGDKLSNLTANFKYIL